MARSKRKTLVHWLSRRARRSHVAAASSQQPSILGDVLSALEPSNSTQDYVFSLAEWSRIVGPRLASKSLPERLDSSGTLFIRVPSSAWAQELTFHTDLIMKKVEEEGQQVKRIRFVIGPISQRQRERTVVEKRRMIPLSRLPDSVESALADVEDERLERLLRRAASVSLGRLSLESTNKR